MAHTKDPTHTHTHTQSAFSFPLCRSSDTHGSEHNATQSLPSNLEMHVFKLTTNIHTDCSVHKLYLFYPRLSRDSNYRWMIIFFSSLYFTALPFLALAVVLLLAVCLPHIEWSHQKQKVFFVFVDILEFTK